MTTVTNLRSPSRAAAAPDGYTDDTGPRIRAFVDSVRPLRGLMMEDDELAAYQNGRGLLERMAVSATGEGEPTISLTAAQCADVLTFMALCEPMNEKRWHIEPTDRPSHLVGEKFILQTLAASLRAQAGVA